MPVDSYAYMSPLHIPAHPPYLDTHSTRGDETGVLLSYFPLVYIGGCFTRVVEEVGRVVWRGAARGRAG